LAGIADDYAVNFTDALQSNYDVYNYTTSPQLQPRRPTRRNDDRDHVNDVQDNNDDRRVSCAIPILLAQGEWMTTRQNWYSLLIMLNDTTVEETLDHIVERRCVCGGGRLLRGATRRLSTKFPNALTATNEMI
jgi:hypothetical protein